MREFKYTITDCDGIHARPAGELVKLAKGFESQIKIIKDNKEADAKKIFAVMGLGIKCGEQIMIIAQGTDEEVAGAEIEKFMKDNL